jgi:hypothetical protein
VNAKHATRDQLRQALHLSDALRRVEPRHPAVAALGDLLAFAAVDDDAAVDRDELLAALEAVGPVLAAHAADGDLRVVQVASTSRPGLSHRVTLAGSRAVSCTCEDAVRHPLSRCKHMASAEQTGAPSAGPMLCVVGPRTRGPRRAARAA